MPRIVRVRFSLCVALCTYTYKRTIVFTGRIFQIGIKQNEPMKWASPHSMWFAVCVCVCVCEGMLASFVRMYVAHTTEQHDRNVCVYVVFLCSRNETLFLLSLPLIGLSSPSMQLSHSQPNDGIWHDRMHSPISFSLSLSRFSYVHVLHIAYGFLYAAFRYSQLSS